MNRVPPSYLSSDEKSSKELPKTKERLSSEDIVHKLATLQPDNEAFIEAFVHIEREAFHAENLRPFRETYPEITPEIEKKILTYLSTEADLSRAHLFSQQTRDFIAFRAWIIGSSDGKLLTKSEDVKIWSQNEKGKYAFEVLLEALFQNWYVSSSEVQELTIHKMRRTFALLINFIETKLPNRFAKNEIRAIYFAALEQLDNINCTYFDNGRHSIGNLVVKILQDTFKNNYLAYLDVWGTENLAKQSQTYVHLVEANEAYLEITAAKDKSVVPASSVNTTGSPNKKAGLEEKIKIFFDVFDEKLSVASEEQSNTQTTYSREEIEAIIDVQELLPTNAFKQNELVVLLQGIRETTEQRGNREVNIADITQELRRQIKKKAFALTHGMTHRFRYSASVLRSKTARRSDRTQALKCMIGIFYDVFDKRMRVSLDEKMRAYDIYDETELESVLRSLKAFHNSIVGYNPHYLWVLWNPLRIEIEPSTQSEANTEVKKEATHKIEEYPVEKPILAADQAELNIVSDILELLPANFLKEHELMILLKNIMGNTKREFDYPQMDNHQAYILRMIEEVLRRLEATTEHFLIENKEQFLVLERYLDGVPHHPIHLNLVGNINIRLANITSKIHKHHSLEIGNKAEAFFVKWLKLHNVESVIDDKATALIEMGHIFLESYHEGWLDRRRGRPYDIQFKPTDGERNPYWKAYAGFDHILDAAEFVNYDNAIKTQINEDITKISRAFRATGKLEHMYVQDFLNEIAGVIFRAYDGMFNVSIREKGFFGSKLGDLLQSDLIDIGFGYFMRIEYPIESKLMIDRGLKLEEDGKTIHHGELHKIVTEIAGGRLAYFIQQATPPEHIGKLIPTDKFKEIKAKNEQNYVDINKYARLRRLILDGEDDLEITVMHQKKFLHGKHVGSELLVRFGHADLTFSTGEVFAFLDVFGIYSEFSKKILRLHFQAAKKLGIPISMNIRGDQFAQKDFVDFIKEQITLSGISPAMITFEILESQPISLDVRTADWQDTVTNLQQLKNLWVHFAIDDYGTGNNHSGLFDELQDLNLFGEWDEVKFDGIYKQSLEELSELTQSWSPEDKRDLLKLEKAIHQKWGRDNTSALLRTLIKNCTSELKIKYTIEQIEPHETHLLEMADALNLIVQGYCYHKPEKVDLKPTVIKSSTEITELAKRSMNDALWTPFAA